MKNNKKPQTVGSLREIGELKAASNGGMDVNDVEALMKDLDNDAIERSNAAFVEGVAKQMEAIEKGENVYRAAAEKLAQVEARIKKMTENNTFLDIFEDTPPIMTLRAKAAQLKEMMQKASEEDKKNPFAAKLLKFRRVHEEVKALVQKGNDALQQLKAGGEISDKTINELKDGYARHLYRFVEKDGWMECVPAQQLKEWSDKHQSFSNAAVSWTVKNCPDHHRQLCDHWYWGANEQGVALCKSLRVLDDVNTRIREFLKKKKQGPAASRLANSES